MDEADLALEVRSRPPRLGSTRLVAVDGPGGAGKSTYAVRLAAACEAQLLHTDDFASWDTPIQWWPRLEEEVLAPLAADRPARYQRYDWVQKSLAQWRTINPGGVLILEGVSSARAAVRDRLSYSVWVDAPRAIRLSRGLARDGEEAKPLWDQWMSVEDAHFAADRTLEHADLVVDGTRPL
jgi:uridine kinase